VSDPTESPFVKICGVTCAEDAAMVADAGADFIGANLANVFARSVTPEVAAGYPRGSAALVGVFVDQRAKEIVSAAQVAGLDVLQLHGEEAPSLFPVLRSEGPWRLWKAVRVRDAADIVAGIDRWADLVDGLLFDAYKEGEPGGTGSSFPWEVLEAVRALMPPSLPVILAGGLHPDNVGDAVARLGPHVVDVSSGVEASLGRKDAKLVRAFVAAAKQRRASDAEQLAVNFSAVREGA
jgi:phosphoribosylanthranilate isomerase